MKFEILFKIGLIICSVILIFSFLFCGLVDTEDPEYIINKDGIVVFLDFEGGFYGIIATDNKHYDPDNLPVEFQQDSLSVNFDAIILKDRASPHMWGTIISITRIERP